MDTNTSSILANITLLLYGHMDPGYDGAGSPSSCMEDARMYADRLHRLLADGAAQPNWKHHPIAAGFYLGRASNATSSNATTEAMHEEFK